MVGTLCDHDLSKLHSTTPFARLIAFDYLDGPSSGVVQCAACPAAYRFYLLAIDDDGAFDSQAWDRGEELRVFGLAPLPTGTFERIADRIASLEPPRWPIWVPGRLASEPTLDRLIGQEIEPLLAAAGPTSIVIAASGPLAPIRSVRELAVPVTGGGTDAQWFSLLGVTVDAALAQSTST